MNTVTVEEAFNLPPYNLATTGFVLKLFLPFKKLYVNGVPFCEVTGTKPLKGNYRVDVSQCPRLLKMTPVILETNHRIYWDNPDRDLGECIFLDTCDNYIELYKQIVDAINAGIDVTLTI